MKREIRQFHRRYNYISTAISRLKCEHSLAHSLRIEPPTKAKKTKQLEWNDELKHSNLIWVNGKLSPLESWSAEERLELLYQTAPAPRVKNQSKLQIQQRQYRLKIKKAISSETKKGNLQAAEFLQRILDKEGHVSYSLIDKFACLKMQRKQQRIKMLKTYLNAHNQLHQTAPTNSVYLQEGIFKIPHQWQVGTDVVSAEEYVEFARQFLAYHFPDYEIKAIICHDDERNKEQDTGCHVHYFLSGLNQQTKSFDLHKRQVQVVNNYVERTYSVREFFSCSGVLNREESQDYGRLFQRMVRDYANDYLYNPKGLQIEFAPETVRRSEQRKRMDREAKLPKQEREYNYYNHQLKQLRELSSEQDRQLAWLEATRETRLHILNDLSSQVDDVKGELEQLKHDEQILADKVASLKNQHDRYQKQVEKIDSVYISHIASICKLIFVRIRAREQNLHNAALDYLNKVKLNLARASPSETLFVSMLARDLDDKDLEVTALDSINNNQIV